MITSNHHILQTWAKYRQTAAMEATSYVGDSRLFLFNYLLRLLRVVALLSVWRAILAGRGTVSGLTMPAVLTYTLIAEVFAELLACRTGLENAWFNGSIATRFLRPFGLFSQFTAEMMGQVGVGLALFSAPLMLCAPALGVNPWPADWQTGALFVVSLALAVSVGLALEFLFAGVAVAVQMHPYAMSNVRGALTALLSGAFVPLALLPWGLGRIFGWLPFAAQASAPLRIYTRTGPPLTLLAMQLAWSVALWPLTTWLWRANREKMVSYGG